MKIPDSIRVLAYDIDVSTPPAIEMDHNEVEGRFLLTSQRIEVRGDRPLMLTREIVLHELLHAVIAISGTRAVMEMDSEYEESMIAVLSPALLCVLRDNPALMDFLLSDD